jgi:hypothetical protein
MNPKKVNILGMELDEWEFASCIAHFGVGPDWATLFDIRSLIEGRGHATTLLREAKAYYEAQNKKVGGSVALNSKMRYIYQNLEIEEYQ